MGRSSGDICEVGQCSLGTANAKGSRVIGKLPEVPAEVGMAVGRADSQRRREVVVFCADFIWQS